MKEETKEKLIGLINFIETMESVILNPYSAGLKTDQLLKDIKQYVKDVIKEAESLDETESTEKESEE